MAEALYENIGFTFEILDEASKKRNIDAILEDIDLDAMPLSITKKDYVIASCIGLMSGFIDAFFVKEISIDRAEQWGQKEVNRFVLYMAKRSGFSGEDLTGAIRHLEKYNLASDAVMSEFGGSKQHHLRDFSHHFSLIGLACSIYTQFSGKAIGTDEQGNLKIVSVPKQLLGSNTEEKIFLGTVEWLFHMASDMAGSNKSPGKGTGIPGPMLSFLKEVSVLPFFESGKANDLNFRKLISKLFNGTALGKRDSNNKLIQQRFDLRGEIGLLIELAKESIPVIINECITRAYYFVKRFVTTIKENKIDTIKGIKNLAFDVLMPYNDMSLTRLLTISHGVMTTIDTADAVIRGAVESYLEGKQKGFYKVALRINYPGIGRFVVAGFIDTKNTVRRNKAINDQLSKTVAQSLELSLFGLTPRQARIYWSLLRYCIYQDYLDTDSATIEDRKCDWLVEWEYTTLRMLGIPHSEIGTFFLTEKQIKKAIGEELVNGEPPYWLYSIAVDILFFKPYYKMNGNHDDLYKKLSANKAFENEKFKLLYEIEPTYTKVIQNLRREEPTVRKGLADTYKRRLRIAGTLVATIVAGGLTYVFAPVIAPVVVGAISEGTIAGLSGVALTNASLAYLGFGSLAAGGFGMAGGTALLSSGSALIAFLSGAGATTFSEWQKKDLNKYIFDSVERIVLFSKVVLYKEYRDQNEINELIVQIETAMKSVHQLKTNPRALIKDWDNLGNRERKKERKKVIDNLMYAEDMLMKGLSWLKVQSKMLDMNSKSMEKG